MDQIKTKFIIAVTNKLAAAEDTTAKVELIEELSDNLYSRYADMVAAGAESGEAYRQAMDELGDVDELLAYLASLGPDGELPRQETINRDFSEELRHNVEHIVRETVNQTKDAVDQASVFVHGIAEKIREKYPNGFKGSVAVHINEKDANGEDGVVIDIDEERNGTQPHAEKKSWTFTAGYDRDRGGFFCENGQSRVVVGKTIPSQDLSEVDIHVNGDVSILVDDNPQADITVDGDVALLEMRTNSDGVLLIRQGNTASSSFFSRRGLACANVTLTLPQRQWEKIQVTTASGDVEIAEGLTVGKFNFRSGSGDLNCAAFTGDVRAESGSGDLDITGDVHVLQASSASGDVTFSGSVREARCTSASGDLSVQTDCMPEHLEMNTKSGDCMLAMPGNEGFTLHYSLVSGELSSEFSLVGQLGVRSGDVIYMDGGTRVYRIASVSGDIHLKQMA